MVLLTVHDELWFKGHKGLNFFAADYCTNMLNMSWNTDSFTDSVVCGHDKIVINLVREKGKKRESGDTDKPTSLYRLSYRESI